MHCVLQNIMIAMSSTSGFCRHLVRIFVDQKSRFLHLLNLLGSGELA